MHPRHRIVVLLASVLVVAGCSSPSDPDPDPSGASGTPNPAATADPTEPAGASEAAESAGLDVCDLLEPADYNRFIDPDLRASATEGRSLDGDLGSFNTCGVSSGPFGLFHFSYSTDPDAWSTIERRTRPQKRLEGDSVYSKSWDLLRRKREEVPNVADEAYLVTGFNENALYALEDGVSYEMGVSGLAGRKAVTIGDYMATMIRLLSRASEGVDMRPVQLPAQCPAADSEAVNGVVGEVERAFGAAYQGKAPACSYVGTDGRMVRAGATVFFTDALFDREALRPERMDRMTLLDPPPGVTSGIRREGAQWAYHSALPDRVETVVVRTGRRSWGPRPTAKVERAAFLAFVDAYRTLASEQLGVEY